MTQQSTSHRLVGKRIEFTNRYGKPQIGVVTKVSVKFGSLEFTTDGVKGYLHLAPRGDYKELS